MWCWPRADNLVANLESQNHGSGTASGAVAEWKKAGEPGNGPNYQIFEQQGAQGYYDDAAATGRLFKRADDVQWSIVELVKIRAENGDIQSAKSLLTA